VVPPFYETRWFLGLVILVGGATTAGLEVRQPERVDGHAAENWMRWKRSAFWNANGAVLARDLHDNMGADLTHLAQLSDLAHADAEDVTKARKYFDQIFELAHNLTRQVDEIVWAVNPANDSLKGFVPFLSNYAQNYLLAAEIPCRFDIRSDFRRRIFLRAAS